MGNSLYKPYSSWVFMGSNPQESLENTINTMGTRTLGVHPSLFLDCRAGFISGKWRHFVGELPEKSSSGKIG